VCIIYVFVQISWFDHDIEEVLCQLHLEYAKNGLAHIALQVDYTVYYLFDEQVEFLVVSTDLEPTWLLQNISTLERLEG
jgi:hypothetical protein